MHKAILNSNLIATKAGDITVYNYNDETWGYISASDEHSVVGIDTPACLCLDAPSTHKTGCATCRSTDFNSWKYVSDHRGEAACSAKTGESKEIKVPGDCPGSTTTIVPLPPYDKRDGEKWVTDTEAQYSVAVDVAEAQRQSLIDAAMASISLIQLKSQAEHKPVQAEAARLNAVLDYTDAVTATDISAVLDIIRPELPEAQVIQYLTCWMYQPASAPPDDPATNYIVSAYLL